MWIDYNPNPAGKRVGDCTVRAISKSLNQSWVKTYVGLFVQGLLMYNMPSANAVWGAYLRRKGFLRYLVPESDADFYTVSDFCRDHRKGVFVLALSEHVVAVADGDYYDTWDSGDEIPVYYWKRSD